jgi:hypothetical protein
MGKERLTLNIHLSMVKFNTPSHDKDTGNLYNSVAGEEGNCSGISP